MKTRPIACRSEIVTIFVMYHKLLSNRFFECPVSDIRMNGALEYIKGDFYNYCSQAGIGIDPVCPYEHQLHGFAERKNHIIQEYLRALLAQSGFEQNLWTFALKMVEYLINRFPTKTNKEIVTPFEVV